MLNKLKNKICRITFDDNTTQDYCFSFVIYIEILLFYAPYFYSWSFLEVTTSSKYNDSIQAYAAGAVEAALTSTVSCV